MLKEIADFSIDYLQKKGANYAESRFESHTSSAFMLKQGISDASDFQEDYGVGVRFLVKKTLGFVSLNIKNKDKVKSLLDRSFELTKKLAKDSENTEFSIEKPVKKSYSVKQKIPFDTVSVKDKMRYLLDLEKETKPLADGRFFSLSDNIISKYYVNTEGSKIEAKIPQLNMFYFINVKNNDQVNQNFWQFGATGGFELWDKWDVNKKIVDQTNELKKVMIHGTGVDPGVYDIVVDPTVTGIMVHESVGHPYEADRIFGRESAQAGESFVNPDHLTKTVSHQTVNVVDDPTLDGSFGFYLYDDEGVRARRKFLIKEGVATEFLHNRPTAKALGVKSNGSARANNFDVEPLVRMSNTFLLPGDHSNEELIKGVKKGIFFKNFMEWNIDDIRMNQKYTANIAYLIENGKITNPVKNPTIEINTPALWKSVDAVGKSQTFHAATCGKGEKMQGIPVWMGGAPMRLRGIKI